MPIVLAACGLAYATTSLTAELGVTLAVRDRTATVQGRAARMNAAVDLYPWEPHLRQFTGRDGIKTAGTARILIHQR